MSAVEHPLRRIRPLDEADLEAVLDIERRAYPYPWSAGVFRDCLRVGYPAWLGLETARAVGYVVCQIAVGECHVLNLCVDPGMRRRGWGRALLLHALGEAQRAGASRVYLEVRPSNAAALGLYRSLGFETVGRRPRYYPAPDGREDALVLARALPLDASA
ncbi:MAG: ribosomal-protein-alanine acetyltransferase [Gammaproteobacteria bacterium]|nr:MAG: ribosomal-protein-alanine acetyltransferase [Gammaproteobacteria bacterium]